MFNDKGYSGNWAFKVLYEYALDKTVSIVSHSPTIDLLWPGVQWCTSVCPHCLTN